MIVLGIETSCDETGVAIYDEHRGILHNIVYSQASLHAKYGGVVPEFAARDHISKIIPLIQKVLIQTGLQLVNIHGIAYTAGPGLINSLMVGATVSHALAYALKVPVIPINHLEGHLLSPMLDCSCKMIFPCIVLLVSGGHTQLMLAYSIGKYKILGETLDDAAGEAFDKVAKLLGLDYPGGALLSEMALHGISNSYIFPHPMLNRSDLNFSFSGLKTFVSNLVRCSNNNFQTYANIARVFEDTMATILVTKCRQALILTDLKNLVVVGGVSANSTLRNQLMNMMCFMKGRLFCSSIEFCTDNAAMIAYVGMIRLLDTKICLGCYNCHTKIFVNPRWSIESL